MKNLRKILIAFLVIAVLTTAVVVTVLADDGEDVSYTGSIETATANYLDGFDGLGSVQKKYERLVALYAYMKASPIDPSKSGYAAFITKCNDYVYAVSEALVLEFEEQSNAEKASETLLKVFELLTAAAEYSEFTSHDKYEEFTIKCSYYAIESVQDLLDVYKAQTSLGSRSTILRKAYKVLTKAYFYEEFSDFDEAAYGEWVMANRNFSYASFDVALVYMDRLERAAGTSNETARLNEFASHWYNARIIHAVNDEDIMSEEFEEEFLVVVTKYNEFALAAVNALIDDAETPAELRAVYKQYGRATPNNTYAVGDFYSRYEKFTDKFDRKLLDIAYTLLWQINPEAKDYRQELADIDTLNALFTEKVDGVILKPFCKSDASKSWYATFETEFNTRVYGISLRYYNEVANLVSEGAEFTEAVNDFLGFLKDCPALLYRVSFDGEYTGSVEEASAILADINAEDDSFLENFAVLYNFLRETAVNPAVDGALEFYTEYEEMKLLASNAVINKIKELNSAPTVEGGVEIDKAAFIEELTELNAISEYLKNIPVSSYAINEYNNAVSAFASTIEKVWFEKLSYTEPTFGTELGDVSAAMGLFELVDVESEDALAAYKELALYLINNPLDTEAEGTAEVYLAFNGLTEKLAARISKELNSLSAKTSYVDIFTYECPELSPKTPVIESINGDVGEAMALVEAALELVEGGELSELLSAYTLAYNYNYKTAVNPSLDGAAAYKTAFNNLTSYVTERIIVALYETNFPPEAFGKGGEYDKDALLEGTETLRTVAEFLSEITVGREAFEEYNEVRAKFLASYVLAFGAELNTERFVSEMETLAMIKDFLKDVPVSAELVAKYNAKAAEFTAEFIKWTLPAGTYAELEAKTFVGDLDDAKLLLGELKASFDRKLDLYVELCAYLKENAIDPAEDGADKVISSYTEFTLEMADSILADILALDASPDEIKAICPEAFYGFASALSTKGDLARANDLLDTFRYALGNPTADIEEVFEAYKALYVYQLKNKVSEDVKGADTFYKNYANAVKAFDERVISYVRGTRENLANLSEIYASVYGKTLTFTEIKYGETGTVSAATELLNAEGDIIDTFPALYKYMTTYGILKTETGAEEFTAAYEARAAEVSAAVIAALNELDANISLKKNAVNTALALNAWAEYLKATPVSAEAVERFNEIAGKTETDRIFKLACDIIAAELTSVYNYVNSVPVSADVVNAYNEEVLKASPYYKSFGYDGIDKALFDKELDKIQKIAEFLKVCPLSLDVVNAYNDSLNAFTITLKGYFDDSYDYFVNEKKNLEDFLSKYSVDSAKLYEEIDYESYKEMVGALSNYSVIKNVMDLVYSVNAEGKVVGVDIYRADFVKALNALLTAPTLDYKADAEIDAYSGTIVEAQKLLDKYNEKIAIADKIAEFENLYQYVANNPLNPRLYGYDEFMKAYEAAGKEVYLALGASIDTADDKHAALSVMREYLVKNPISNDAIRLYNAKCLTVYKEAIDKLYDLTDETGAYTADEDSYAEATEKLHEYIESTIEIKDLITGKTSKVEVADIISTIEGLEAAFDNYELLETELLVQFYKLKTLTENSANASVTDMGASIKIIKNYTRRYPISELSYGYEDILDSIDSVVRSYDELLEAAKVALDEKTPFDEYRTDTYTVVHNFDAGTNTLGFSGISSNPNSKSEVLEDKARGGYYVKYTYGSNETSGYIGASGIKSQAGCVIEFDLSGDNGVAKFTVNRLDRTSGSPVQKTIFRIDSNKFYFGGSDSAMNGKCWEDKEVITPGEWTKFIFVYEPVNMTLTGYIDYECIGTWEIKSNTPTDELVELRINASNSSKGATVNVDNFKIYAGTNFRILDKFESMTTGEKLSYFVDLMYNESKEAITRLEAYKKASALVDEISRDESLAASLADIIEKFNAIDPVEKITKPAMEANIHTLNDYVTKIERYNGNVNTSNYAAVNLLVTGLDTFISANSDYIDKTSDAYKTATATVSRYKTALLRCQHLISFIDSLEKFRASTTLVAKTKHYEKANEYYELAEFYNAEIRASVIDDAAVKAFVAFVNENLREGEEAYADIFAFFNYCPSEIAETERRDNSQRIIDCINLILSLKDYEASDEFFEANFDYINKYATIVRDVLRQPDMYDPDYEGLNAARESFAEIDPYFYAKLQENHIAFIEEQLDKYETTTSYIERLGICIYVQNYIDANDIDYTNKSLAALVERNRIYSEELVSYKDEYAKILEENTLKFINVVNEMKSYTTYAALKERYDKALAYYYEMNISSEAASKAIKDFEEYAAKLAVIESDSEIFKGFAKSLASARTDAQKFKALVNCKDYVYKASADIDGVEDYIELYESTLAEYNEMANTTNSNINEVNSLVVAVRTNAIAEAIMSVVNKIFNK